MLKLTKNKRMFVITFLFLALITPILGGCSMDIAGLGDQAPMLPEEEARQARDDMLKHLNNKYGEQFKTNGLRSATTKQQSMDFWLASDTDENSQNWATCQRIVNDDGSIEYKDDWARYIFKPTYKKEVEEIVKNYFPNPEYKVDVSFCLHDFYPDEIRSVSDRQAFDEFLKKPSNESPTFEVYITLPAESEDEIDFNAFTRLEEQLKTMSYCGNLTVRGLPYSKWQENPNSHDFSFTKIIWWGYPEDKKDIVTNDVWE